MRWLIYGWVLAWLRRPAYSPEDFAARERLQDAVAAEPDRAKRIALYAEARRRRLWGEKSPRQ